MSRFQCSKCGADLDENHAEIIDSRCISPRTYDYPGDWETTYRIECEECGYENEIVTHDQT